MNSIYAEVLGTLVRKGVVNNKLDIENILKLINSGVDDTLESKFQTEIIEKYSVKCLAIKCDVSKVDEFIDDWGLLLDCESKPGIYCITVDRKIVYIGKTILEI